MSGKATPPCDSEKPFGFGSPRFDASSFGTIEVPSSWQMQGYDFPIYCNVQYPWEGHERMHPPFAPVEFQVRILLIQITLNLNHYV